MKKNDAIIKVTLDSETLAYLKKNYFKLCSFRGVQVSSAGFVPLILFTNTNYLANTTIKISNESLLGYISTKKLVPGVQIIVDPPAKTKDIDASSNASIKIEIGQKMIIDSYGNLSVMITSENDIQIQNNSSTQYVTGICDRIDAPETFAPFCAKNIGNGEIIKLVPTYSVLLTFSSDFDYKEGVYIENLSNTGLLIQASGNTTRNVSYSEKDGWNFNNASWGKIIEAGSTIGKQLITHMSS